MITSFTYHKRPLEEFDSGTSNGGMLTTETETGTAISANYSSDSAAVFR